MSITHRSLIPVVVALAVAAGIVVVAAETTHLVVPVDAVKWGPAAVLPPGAEMAVLEGNPAEKGPITLRLKFPANYQIPAHRHSMTERVTVLSGKFNVGMGDKLDRKATQLLTPGGFVSLPGNMNHFAWASEPTIVQITLDGPFDIFYVNPADNPAASQSTKK
jgi:quercetin dioxygenase-like cupin family protein